MRKIYIPIFIWTCLSLFGCKNPVTSKSAYVISGAIANAAEGDTVMLQEEQGQNLIILSKTYIKNGKFQFTGRQDSTVERIITYVKNGVKMGAVFFLENGHINMLLDETSSITGTPNNDKYQTFLNQINGIYGQMSSVNDNLADSIASDTIHTDMNQKVKELDKKANELIIKTIKDNINNPIGFYLFKRYNYILDAKLQYFLISRMPVSWRRNPDIEDIKTQLDLLPEDSVSICVYE